MRRDDARRRSPGRGPRRQARPGVEGLEGRLLLYATTGGAWTHPGLITYSIVGDGTNVGGYASNLFQSFNAKWSQATWMNTIAQAAAIWEQVANINLVPIADHSAPIGSGPDQQGDPNQGDIRISGLPSSVLGSGALGYTFLPPPINGDSSSGDIIFNTSQPWQINNGNYDLLTVAIHEFGHALGMGHSAISTADMYATYDGIKQTLTSDDTSGIQSIYGPRQPDSIMAGYHNSSSSSAFDLTPYLDSYGRVVGQGLDIQTPTSAEWFKVTVPSSTSGTMVVTMQSTNISLLSPYVQVFNASLQSVGYSYAPGAFGATVSTTITGVKPGQVYYIGATAANGGATGAGNYGLLVNLGSQPQYPIPLQLTAVPVQPSQGGGGLNDSGGTSGQDGGPWSWGGPWWSWGGSWSWGDPGSSGGNTSSGTGPASTFFPNDVGDLLTPDGSAITQPPVLGGPILTTAPTIVTGSGDPTAVPTAQVPWGASVLKRSLWPWPWSH